MEINAILKGEKNNQFRGCFQFFLFLSPIFSFNYAPYS